MGIFSGIILTLKFGWDGKKTYHQRTLNGIFGTDRVAVQTISL